MAYFLKCPQNKHDTSSSMDAISRLRAKIEKKVSPGFDFRLYFVIVFNILYICHIKVIANFYNNITVVFVSFFIRIEA